MTSLVSLVPKKEAEDRIHHRNSFSKEFWDSFGFAFGPSLDLLVLLLVTVSDSAGFYVYETNGDLRIDCTS